MNVNYQNLWIQAWVSIGLFLIATYVFSWNASWAWFVGLAVWQAFIWIRTKRKK